MKLVQIKALDTLWLAVIVACAFLTGYMIATWILL